MTDNLTPMQRHRAMRAVKRSNTSPEMALRRALTRGGIRGYRVDFSALPGRPDLAFTRHRVAIFVDGGFWHGHPSRFPRPGLSQYWLDKISGTRARDGAINDALANLGWTVLRFWDWEVTQHGISQSVDRVAQALDGRSKIPERDSPQARPRSAKKRDCPPRF